MNFDQEPIRHVKDLDPLSSDLVSTPTKELEDRIRILENAIASITRKGTVSNVVIKDRTIHSSVNLYNTVYYNNSTGLYEPTIAKVEFTGNSFQTLQTGLVIGIVVKIVGNTADILVDGVWPAAAFKDNNNLLEPGEKYIPGKPYYLSSDYYGRVTSRPPALAVQVLLSADDSIIMNKVYGSPEGFEKAAKFEMGMRPVGSFRSIGNRARIVGFDGLESDALDGTWESTAASGTIFTNSGYMVAEGWALSVSVSPVWVEIVTGINGHLTINTASSLAQLSAPDISTETFTDFSYEAADVPFAVSAQNHHDVRSYVVKDANGVSLQRIKFKFVCNEGETFNTDKYRSVIFKIPDSFQGWKEVDTNGIETGAATTKFQIQPYYAEGAESDYPDFSHIPATAPLYYDTKADFGFVQNWPAEPIDKAIVMINGVETLTSILSEEGIASPFAEDIFDMGVSTKTLYWATSYIETQPWDLMHRAFSKAVSGTHNSSSEIGHRDADASNTWYWQESTYAFEPKLNRGWVYTNKLSVYHKSSRVLGLGVLPPFKIKDTVTGLEPTYAGEPMSGNLLLWNEDVDNVTHRTQDIQLGQFSLTPIYTNDTKFNVVLREIIFIVRSQNNSQLSNEDLGKSYNESDYALVDIGTGMEGKAVSNIKYRTPIKVLEYNTSCVITLDSEAAIIPPNGVVRLSVYRPFDAEQTVSTIVNGRVF